MRPSLRLHTTYPVSTTLNPPPIPQTWFPMQELARRQRILEDLRDRRIAQLPIASLFADTGARDLEP